MKTVLDAALAELGRGGYANLTMDAVIRRAKVSRTTVYRRWPNKFSLVAALVEQMQNRLIAAPPAATLREDLRQLLSLLTHNLETPAQREVARASTTNVARALQRSSRELAMRPLIEAFARAQGRGEAGPDDSPSLLTEMLFDLVANRSLQLDRALTDAETDAYIEVVMRSLRPKARRSS